MVEVERADTVRAGFLKISLSNDHAAGVSNPPSGLLSAVSEQVIVNPKGPCFSDSPREHLFTANAVLEDGFPLKYERDHPVLRKLLCESLPAEATTDDDDVIFH